VEDSDLIERLLAQNDRLIDALAANQPVEVIRALNPPPIYPARAGEPWGDDASKGESGDLWGDSEVPTEALLAMGTGWVGGDDGQTEIESDQ